MSITTVEAAGQFGTAIAHLAARGAIVVVTHRTKDFVKASGEEEKAAFINSAVATDVEVQDIAFGVLDPTETFAVFPTPYGAIRLEWADKPEDEDVVLYDIYDDTGLAVPDVPAAGADAEEVSLDTL